MSLYPVFVDEWPTEGKIDIIGLSVKYREELDFALKNLSLSIPARAKVQYFVLIRVGFDFLAPHDFAVGAGF